VNELSGNLNLEAEDIRPIVFSAPDGAALFGCLHMPVSVPKRNGVVVICGPVGHEYERCHRALRRLSATLAQAGIPSFRFDYRGCGDSDGDVNDTFPAHWLKDADAAIETARKMAKVDHVAVLGLRLGAVIARRAAAHCNPAALVLWHEIGGTPMLCEWDELERRMARDHGWAPSVETSVLGWPLSATWRNDIAGLESDGAFSPELPTLVLTDKASEAGSSSPFVSMQIDEGSPIWLQEPMHAIVPFVTISCIVDWLSKIAND